MSDVYILGTDMIKFGRFPDRSVPSLGAEAALMALDDANLTVHQMEALCCGNLGQAGAMVGQRILQEIGQTGIPVVNTANACAERFQRAIKFTAIYGGSEEIMQDMAIRMACKNFPANAKL